MWGQAKESGVTPNALLLKPEIPLEVSWVWVAFSDLSTTRQVTQVGLSVISWLSVIEYAKHMQVNRDDFEILWSCVQAMDKVFLEQQDKMSKAQSKGRGK